MIKLVKLEMRNFLSHIDSTLNLSEYEGLVLIEGVNLSGYYQSNGSGKSTILEGIVYALTGNTLRGLGVNDVINRNAKKNTRVTLTFSVDDIEYKVIRCRKDDEFGDSLIFYKGGENVSKRLNKDTQTLIDNTLGISYKVLVSTMLMGEGLSSRFTQLSDPEKKSLIESTLNLSYDLSSIRTKASSHVKSLELSKSNLEGKLSALKEMMSVDIESINKSISEESVKRDSYLSELGNLESKVKEVNEQIGLIDKKIALVRASITNLDNLEVERTNLCYQRSLEKETLDKVMSETPQCPLCHQSLRDEESLKLVSSTYEKRVSEIDSGIQFIDTQIQSSPDRQTLESALTRFDESYTPLASSLSELNTQLDQVSQAYHSSNAKLGYLRFELSKCDNPNGDIPTVEGEISDLSTSIDKYEYFSNLFSPTGIIVSILSEAVEYINSRLSVYSEVLLEKKYSIYFKKGKISLVDDTGSSYASLSAGEKKRLDLSIQFSLHDYVMKYCGIQVDCMYIDEVLDALDRVGVDNILTVLRMKLDYCNLKSIFVITHNEDLKSYFDNLVRVEKDIEGNSKLI